MIPALLSVLLALAGSPGPAGLAAPSCKTADQRLEKLIATHARALNATEYCQARIYHTVDDLDGDARDDFVVVFELEARDSNNSVQFLAVFLSGLTWKPLVLKVGGRGERFVDQIDVEEGRTLVLTTSEYEVGDAMCCPSGDGELRFRVDHGRLKAVEAPPESQTTPTVASMHSGAAKRRALAKRSASGLN